MGLHGVAREDGRDLILPAEHTAREPVELHLAHELHRVLMDRVALQAADLRLDFLQLGVPLIESVAGARDLLFRGLEGRRPVLHSLRQRNGQRIEPLQRPPPAVESRGFDLCLV